jgi:hypothetical protein
MKLIASEVDVTSKGASNMMGSTITGL